jgi:hypothetical protein
VASRSGGSSSGGGCGGLIAFLLIVGLIVGAAISLAAVVDPFGWMPPLDVIWGDCDGDCALAHRFPGFWWHVVANLVFTAVALVLTFAFGAAVTELRKARVARYDSAAAMEKFCQAHAACVGGGKLLAGLAALPLVIAILT